MRRWAVLALAALLPLSACGLGDLIGGDGGQADADSRSERSTRTFDDQTYCRRLDALYRNFIYPIDEDVTLRTYQRLGPTFVDELQTFADRAPKRIRPSWKGWHAAVAEAVPLMDELAEFIAVVESDDPAAQRKLDAMTDAEYERQSKRYDAMYASLESETTFSARIEEDAETRCGWTWQDE